MLTVLAFLAGTTVIYGRSAIRQTTQEMSRFEAEILAESALYLTVYELQNDQKNHIYGLEPVSRAFDDHSYDVIVTPVTGRIDLNRSDQQTLATVFTEVGLNSNKAMKLAAAIADWRDPDEVKRLNGAEKSEYHVAGRSYGPSNAPFESISELNWVLGMTPEVYTCVASALTVFSGQAKVDLAYAPEIVKAAFKNSLPRPQPSSQRFEVRDGDVVEIKVSVLTEARQHYDLVATVRITGNVQSPYWILDWQFGAPKPPPPKICHAGSQANENKIN